MGSDGWAFGLVGTVAAGGRFCGLKAALLARSRHCYGRGGRELSFRRGAPVPSSRRDTAGIWPGQVRASGCRPRQWSAVIRHRTPNPRAFHASHVAHVSEESSAVFSPMPLRGTPSLCARTGGGGPPGGPRPRLMFSEVPPGRGGGRRGCRRRGDEADGPVNLERARVRSRPPRHRGGYGGWAASDTRACHRWRELWCALPVRAVAGVRRRQVASRKR